MNRSLHCKNIHSVAAIILAFAFSLSASTSWALSLTWDPVVNDADGQPLANPVTEYRLYQCGPTANCTKANGTVIATIPAPAVTFNIDGQPIPQSYTVTAKNLIGESDSAIPVKVVPPDKPKNFKLQP